MNTATPSSIRDIKGVLTMFYYRDLDTAAAWYEKLIGFEPVMRMEGFVLFRIHESSHLALVADGHGSQTPIPGSNKGAILSIQTENLELWHHYLFERGVEGTGRELQTGGGGRTIEFKVYDPEGYTVEFFEWID